MRNFKFFLVIVGVACLLPLFSGCEKKQEIKKVHLDKRVVLPAVVKSQGLRVAIGGMITPRSGYVYYKDFFDYIAKKMGVPINVVDREDYVEINQLLKNGQLDAAFVCSGPYVDGKKDFGLELLAMPVAYGQTVYYSYIIVPQDSALVSLEDLRGKTFAFADPQSNSGKLVPTYMLAKMNETPETFFKKYIFTHSHDNCIKSVSQKLLDGAAVDSLMCEYANSTSPEFTSRTKIILKSPPYGIPPFVVRQGLAVGIHEPLRALILSAHEDPVGQAILKKMAIDRFVPGDDKAYDSVREMKVWLDTFEVKKEVKKDV